MPLFSVSAAAKHLLAPNLLTLTLLTLTLPALASAQTTSPLRLHPQAVVWNSEQLQPKHLSVQVWLNKDLSGVGMSQYSVGDELHVGVLSSQDAYIYLFNISSNGRVTLFLPNGYDAPRANLVKGYLVKAGVKATFPAAGAYTLKVGGPLGQNRIVALATRSPLSLGALVSAGQGFYTVNSSGEGLGNALSSVLGNLKGSDWASAYTWYGVGEPGNGNEDITLANTTPVSAAVPAPLPQVTSTTTTVTVTTQATFQAGELPNHTVNPVLRAAYNRASPGIPTGPVQPLDGGLWQTFAGSSKAALLMAPGARIAYMVRGAALERYLALGGGHIPAALGWPTADQMPIARNSFGSVGSAATFQKGGLYSGPLGTYALTGPLWAKYQALGGPRSALGFPVGNQSGAAMQFEGGTLRLVGGSVELQKK